MIRKTSICVLGLLAGAGTGAYVDGFFEEDNIVTNTYQQVVEGLSPSTENAEGYDPESFATSDTDADGETDDKLAGDEDGSGMKLAQKDTEEKPDEEATTSMADNSSAKGSGAKDAEDSLSGSGKQDSDKKMAAGRLADSENDKGSKTSADSDDTEESVMDDTKEKTASEKEAELEKARSLALMDVRFNKDVFRSDNGGELNYRKLSPRTAGTTRKLPLVVFLHGSGERGDDNVSQLKHGLTYFASPEGMREFPATVIAPQCPKGDRWSTSDFDAKPTEPMRMTQELIELLVSNGEVDPDRIYVTGLSMGGFGTFDLIAREPSTFAAAVPLCGGGDTQPKAIDQIKKTPLWVIHGDADPVVDVKNSQEIVEALEDAGAFPRYTELPGFKHNIWDAAYADKELYKWLFSQSKSKNQKLSNRRTATSRQTTSIGPRDASNAASPTIKKSLQGNWRVLAATQRGRRADSATLAKMKVKFSGDDLIISIGDKNETATFELPPTEGSPYPLIDIMSQKKTVKDSAGILAAKGDKLVICWGMPGKPRPTAFNSSESVKTLVLEKK